MKWNWKEWLLVSAAILLMAFLHRLTLLAIIAPLSLAISYGLSRMRAGRHSGQRRI